LDFERLRAFGDRRRATIDETVSPEAQSGWAVSAPELPPEAALARDGAISPPSQQSSVESESAAAA